MAINETTYSKEFKPNYSEQMNSGITKKVYRNNKEDTIVDDLENICIHLNTSNSGSSEFSQFLWVTANSTSEISVTTRHPYQNAERSEEKYTRKIEIITMPPKNPPKELTDFLKEKEFQENSN